MGMADAMETNKANYINLEELLDYVKDGKLAKFRSTNGLTRGDLGRYIGISSKYLQRIENLANYPVDRIVKAIKKKIATVHSV
jgi:DNA-binding XRE family transcriptional regulator